MMQQLNFAFESDEAEARAATAAIASRLTALEKVAMNCRIAWDEVSGRVMRALGHLCGSRPQQAKGLTGLRWAGPVGELAADKMVNASVPRVRAVLKRLEQLGVITKETHRNWRGQDDGLLITLEMARINQLSKVGNHLVEYPPNHLLDYPVKYPPDYPPNYLPQIEPTLYTVLPSLPNTPPPTEESSAERSVDEPSASSVVKDSNRSAADFENCLLPPANTLEADVAELDEAFEAIGLDRHLPLANEFVAKKRKALEAIQIYRAQQSKFNRPGAVVEFLRSGAWPVAGVRSLEEIEANKRKSEARQREAAIERRRGELVKQDRTGFSESDLKTLRDAGLMVGS